MKKYMLEQYANIFLFLVLFPLKGKVYRETRSLSPKRCHLVLTENHSEKNISFKYKSVSMINEDWILRICFGIHCMCFFFF